MSLPRPLVNELTEKDDEGGQRKHAERAQDQDHVQSFEFGWRAFHLQAPQSKPSALGSVTPSRCASS